MNDADTVAYVPTAGRSQTFIEAAKCRLDEASLFGPVTRPASQQTALYS